MASTLPSCSNSCRCYAELSRHAQFDMPLWLCCFLLEPDTMWQQIQSDNISTQSVHCMLYCAIHAKQCNRKKSKHAYVARSLLAKEAQGKPGLPHAKQLPAQAHPTWKICLSRGCRCRCHELRMKSSSNAMTGARMTTPSQKAGVLKRCGPSSTMSVSVLCSGSIELKPHSAGIQQPMLRLIMTALIHVK